MVKSKKSGKRRFLSLPIVAFDTVQGRTATAISAAFAFVIALTWNDAIKQGVNNLIEAAGFSGASYLYTISSAVIVTFIGIIGITLASRIAGDQKK